MGGVVRRGVFWAFIGSCMIQFPSAAFAIDPPRFQQAPRQAVDDDRICIEAAISYVECYHQQCDTGVVVSTTKTRLPDAYRGADGNLTNAEQTDALNRELGIQICEREALELSLMSDECVRGEATFSIEEHEICGSKSYVSFLLSLIRYVSAQ